MLLAMPDGVRVNLGRKVFCDLRGNDQMFRSSRNGFMQGTRRGDPLWEQVVTLLTEDDAERDMQVFLDDLDGYVNSVSAPDYLALFDLPVGNVQPSVMPYFDELFFTPGYLSGDPAQLVINGAHTAGETEISVTANVSRFALKRASRVQIDLGLYRLTADLETSDSGVGLLRLRPGLRTDLADGVVINFLSPRGCWKLMDYSEPERFAPGVYERGFRLVEDLQTIVNGA